MRKDKAKQFRAATQIAANLATDEQAATMVSVYDPWSGNGVDYTVGDRTQFLDDVYKCTISHTSQADWAPNVAVSLWEKI